MSPELDALTVQNAIEAIGFVKAETEPQMGKWRFLSCSCEGSALYKCSLCGRTTNLPREDYVIDYAPYCHCGAKMDVGNSVDNVEKV